MINFLVDPNEFRLSTSRVASVGEQHIRRVVVAQWKQAKTFKEAANLFTNLKNLVHKGVLSVKNFGKMITNAFHSLTRFIILNPVLKYLTIFFQELAYSRLLEGMYDAWERGALDREKEYEKRTAWQYSKWSSSTKRGKTYLKKKPKVQGHSGFGMIPFYEEYEMGYEGESLSSIRARAKMVAKRDLGTRTISEMLKSIFDTLNIYRDGIAFARSLIGTDEISGREVKWNRQKVKIDGSILTFVFKFILLLKLEAIGLGFLYTSLPLALAALFYYSPSEGFLTEGLAYRKLKKSLFGWFNKVKPAKCFNEWLEEEVKSERRFIRDALEEDLPELRKSF